MFNIEEFAIHDGPGIRTLVFFKGCPLHCTWCHNPEGLSFRKELMVSIAACIHCERCKQVCPHKECLSCGKCVDVCPLNLRKICGQEMESGVLSERLLKMKEILIKSGGGITISGGEPLAQPKFLFDLIRALKPVNVAVETSGYAEAALFQEVVSEADFMLMDIKHTDPEIHKKFTGVDNALILDNLKHLCLSATDFCIRIPLIPGVNDTMENMEQTALLIKDAKHLQHVELLPYHQTAPAKYAMVGKTFNPGFDTDRKVKVYTDIFKEYNIKVSVL